MQRSDLAPRGGKVTITHGMWWIFAYWLALVAVSVWPAEFSPWRPAYVQDTPGGAATKHGVRETYHQQFLPGNAGGYS